MASFMPVDKVSDELWNKVINVNLNSAFYACRAAIPVMINHGGVILNTASIAGIYGGSAGDLYTVSKHGLIGLTKHIAAFYGDKGIRCNAMALGAVATNIGTGSLKPDEIGMKIMQKTFSTRPEPASPAEIANLGLFLVSDLSKSINGSIVIADKGWTVY